MRFALPFVAIAALALTGCKAKPDKPAAIEEAGQPQVATSIDDYALPADKSDQITSIDAATGDASGMPRDGGAVVQAPKAVTRAAAEPTEADNGQVAVTPAAQPLPPAPAKPAFTIEDVPGTK